MKNTRASGWVVMVGLVSASALGGCDLVAGIGEFCEIGVDPGCGTGGTGGAGGGGTGGTTTSPTGGGGTGGASGCSPMGTEQPCYSGPDGTQDVGICVGGTQTCQADGTWGLCEGQVEPGIETCASTDDEDCDARECALWSTIFGDADEQFPLDVAFDKQGNVIVLGAFKGKISFGNEQLESAGARDLFVVKFSPDGQYLWGKRYGDANDQWLASLAIDSSDNIILAGKFEGAMDFGGKVLTAASGGTDLFVVKLTPTGAFAWGDRRGDAADQSVDDVAVDANDNVIVIGEFAGSVSFKDQVTAINGTDLYVARLRYSDGLALWQSTFDDKDNQTGTLNVTTGPSGSWAITGKHGNGASIGGAALNGLGTFVSAFDANDTLKWSVDVPVSTPSGLSFDSAGNLVLSADISGPVTIAGAMLTSKGDADIVLVKLGGATGAAQWAHSFGGAGNDQVARLSLAPDDSIFFALTSSSPGIDFGGGELRGAGQTDLFVTALKSDGEHYWSRNVGDATFQSFQVISFDKAGNSLAVAIRTNGTINFGAGDLNSNGNDIALAKLAP